MKLPWLIALAAFALCFTLALLFGDEDGAVDLILLALGLGIGYGGASTYKRLRPRTE